MEKTMLAYRAKAQWRPRESYELSERELRDRRAMRANYVYRNLTAHLTKVPVPTPGKGEVLLQIGACGICGSDLHVLKSGADDYTAYGLQLRLPVTLGHEIAGQVVELGPNVTSVQKGDLIAVEQIRWCGECPSCRQGMFNQCLRLEETGLSCDGGFAEYMLVPEKYCCVINDLAEHLGSSMAAMEAGALAEPTCVAYSGIQINADGLKAGSHVAVFGAGPIGLCSIALARAMGAAKIIAFSTNPARDPLARAVGADYVFNPNELASEGHSAGAVVLELTNGIGAGMIIEASGSLRTVYPEMMKCVGVGGKILQLGVGTEPALVETATLLQKNARIYGSMGHAGSGIYPSVLRMMASGRIDMRQIITARYTLSNIDQAFAACRQRELGHGKIMIGDYE
ncbi:MAG: scyllo-inosose 3-dehydrogenase [Eubacteriales bacterium]|nr:scyllo-inosose 3-dehydrogenase [Eubacteriales bacterium]